LLTTEPPPERRHEVGGRRLEWWVLTGGYRVVYEIHGNVLLILVVAAGHRREICDRR